ncbi:MAG TPA: ABC transporter ATP-binding protein [Acidimicrobiales bacterium]|nr:ABC transporter ATP-binding protein [Acidimicrobiales bacterium]
MEPDPRGTPQEVPVVSVGSLTKVLPGQVVALNRVDLTVMAGQAMGLAGPNGAGKSTLLRILLGLVRPTSGSARLFGEPVRPGAKVLGRIGCLVDGPGFVPYLTGRDNLRLAVRSSGRTVPSAEFEVALEASGLDAALDRPYRSYSHGMRYRLGLAQAMIGRPELLILDEPTTGLDPVHASEVTSRIKAATAAGTTVLLCSHELAFIDQVCSDVVVLHEGRVVLAGGVAAIVESAGSLEEAYLRAVTGSGRGTGLHEIRAKPVNP